ncbi:hypothetical protein [Rhizobium sp. L9]|nr:hypothetical protein [Rhizobium sp. L9]
MDDTARSAGGSIPESARMLPIRSESRHLPALLFDFRRNCRRQHAMGAPADVVERPFLCGRSCGIRVGD